MYAQSKMALFAILVFAATTAAQTTIGGLSGSHTNIPRWCGKPYMAGSPNFNPGGMLAPPAPLPSPMLYVQIQPRYSVYDSSENTAAFIVDADLSYTHGEPYQNATSNPGFKGDSSFGTLDFDIRVETTDELLLSSSVSINTTGNVYEFELDTLTPSLTPYSIVLYGAPTHEISSNQTYTATSDLYYLPAKKNGSTVKVDNMYGGLVVANNASNFVFEPLLPFGFYTSCSGYLNDSIANISAYKDMGFNAINPVCAFTDGPLDGMFDGLDEYNVLYQYDMRGSYLNLTQVAQQIPLVQDRPGLLSYYTADEPDGWQYALNSTTLAYNLLKQQDPYHPVALVLNCDNYYFEDYSAGADYIMEDAYPVAINATYSIPWNTTCNETYGDCGCDDCIGELQDVSNRLDAFYEYQEWLGEEEKPLWAVLQAFSGEGYWARDPTDQETWAMITISFNHLAKGIMSWIFPASDTLNEAHSAYAKVATVPPVSKFMLNASPVRIAVAGHPLLDVAYWQGSGDEIMVGFANLDYADSDDTIDIEIPKAMGQVSSQPWGSLSWSVSRTSNSSSLLSTYGLDGLATSLVILCP